MLSGARGKQLGLRQGGMSSYVFGLERRPLDGLSCMSLDGGVVNREGCPVCPRPLASLSWGGRPGWGVPSAPMDNPEHLWLKLRPFLTVVETHICRRVGIKLMPEGLDTCPMANERGQVCGQPLTEFHVDCCPSLQALRSRRHNHLQQRLVTSVKSMGALVRDNGIPRLQDNFQLKAKFKNAGSWYGDILVEFGAGTRKVVDLAVTGAVSTGLLRSSKIYPAGEPARRMERSKTKKLQKHFHVEVASELSKFVAFVAETSGGFGSSAMGLLKDMRMAHMANGDTSKAGNHHKTDETLNRSLERMSASIHKDVGYATFLLASCCEAELARRKVLSSTHNLVGTRGGVGGGRVRGV